MTLKEARKEAREYLLETSYCRCEHISYRKDKGFYTTLSQQLTHKFKSGKCEIEYKQYETIKDAYTVFEVYRDGTMESVHDTEHAKKFHKKREEMREKEYVE